MERVLREEKGEGELWERQWRWLDKRYRYIHDRVMVVERRAKQQKSYYRWNTKTKAAKTRQRRVAGLKRAGLYLGCRVAY
jgi:hypothetical protein